MEIEFSAKNAIDFFRTFAGLFDAEVKGNTFSLPAHMGTGSGTFFEIGDVSNSFFYISFGENLLYSIFSELMFHKIMFGQREFNYEQCIHLSRYNKIH